MGRDILLNFKSLLALSLSRPTLPNQCPHKGDETRPCSLSPRLALLGIGCVWMPVERIPNTTMMKKLFAHYGEIVSAH
jgi:hypothetical protein